MNLSLSQFWRLCESFMPLQFGGWVFFLFFLHCHYHIDVQKTIFHELQSADENILNDFDNEIVELLLYVSKKFNFQQNCSLLESAIKFILNYKDLIDQCCNKRKHTHLSFFFQSHVFSARYSSKDRCNFFRKSSNFFNF